MAKRRVVPRRRRHEYRRIEPPNQFWSPPRICRRLFLSLAVPAILRDCGAPGALPVPLAAALVDCDPDAPDGDAFCAGRYRPGSRCEASDDAAGGGGRCSNPFLSGCLRNYLGEDEFSRVRVCNSDDGDGAAERGECVESGREFGYQEVRILSQNWEGAMFSAWIMQIVLSEVLGVPATIETGKADESGSFYDKKLGFSYGSMAYDYDALHAALKHGGNCQKFQTHRKNNNKPYKSCAHVVPEVWNGQKKKVAALEKEGLIEPTIGTGSVGKLSWYIPYFTAARDSTLLSYFGLAVGNDLAKRRKVAETFLRPQTWGFFCENMTSDNCASPYSDIEGRLIAARPPADETEASQYFSRGSYHGHFNATEENDCDKHPQTCTGHIVNLPCEWSTFAVSQADHLGIPVSSAGSLDAGGGYSYGDIVDIYHAANYTKSDVLMYWWTPEVNVEEYHGTDSEFQRILLPPPSAECIESRVTQEERCAGSPTLEGLGGSCDSEAHTLQKLVVSNLYEITHPVANHLDPSSKEVHEEALQSPAYDAIKGIQFSDLQVESMFRTWYGRDIDKWNYDPRDAVCAWTAENLSALQRHVPPSYPRSIRANTFDKAASYAATAVAIIAMMSVCAVLAFTWRNKKNRVFVYAQPRFLFLLLLGLGLVCIGAVLYAMEPSVSSCIAIPYFVVLGNALMLVPLIVKVAAINKVLRMARSMRRSSVRPSTLYKATGAIMGLTSLYLLIWMIIDPYTMQTKMELSTDANDDGGQIVHITSFCLSKSPVWTMTSFLYQFLLLIVASVIAFQNRKAESRFNEASRLSLVIYSHFLFTLLRGILWLLQAKLDYNTVTIASSFMLSFDAFACLGAYFFPQIKDVIYRDPSTPSQLSTSQTSSSVEQLRRNVSQCASQRNGTTFSSFQDGEANSKPPEVVKMQSTVTFSLDVEDTSPRNTESTCATGSGNNGNANVSKMTRNTSQCALQRNGTALSSVEDGEAKSRPPEFARMQSSLTFSLDIDDESSSDADSIPANGSSNDGSANVITSGAGEKTLVDKSYDSFIRFVTEAESIPSAAEPKDLRGGSSSGSGADRLDNP